MNPEVMPYTRDVSKIHPEAPIYIFKGDEKVSPADYLAAMRNTYLRKVPLGSALMERFGIPFSKEDQERVKRSLVVMGWLDHLIDEADDRQAALQAYEQLITFLQTGKPASNLPTWLRPELLCAVVLVRNAVAILPQQYADLFTDKAMRISKISVEKSHIQDRNMYADILREEGALSSDVVLDALSPEVKQHTGYKKMYTWNQRAMSSATLLDGSIDLKEDYREKLTGVSPTPGNRMGLLLAALRYLPLLLTGLRLRGIVLLAKIGAN